MKLIHDCVRDVMLYIEENLKLNDSLDINNIQNDLSDYSLEDIAYTCEKLNEAKYLEVKQYITGATFILKITYDGHVFLDTIRDNDIWKETKSKISKLASVSLPIIQQVAAQLISFKLGIL